MFHYRIRKKRQLASKLGRCEVQKIALVGIKSNPVESEPVGEIPSAAKMMDQLDKAKMATPNTKPIGKTLSSLSL